MKKKQHFSEWQVSERYRVILNETLFTAGPLSILNVTDNLTQEDPFKTSELVSILVWFLLSLYL